MKRLKFLMAFVFLLVGTLTLLSFTNHKYRKEALTTQCLKYIGPHDYLLDYHILQSVNWTSAFTHPEEYCMSGPYLCAICYDSFSTTPNQARQILYDYYRNVGHLPVDGAVIFGLNGKSIVVYKTIEVD